MSTTLPEDAPAESAEVPSVEEQTPEAGSEVDEESVGEGEEPKTVPAERFNGLMGTFNKTKSELDQTREQLAQLEARLKETESQQEATPEVSDTSSLEARVDQLTELLTTERLENARNTALKEHPEAAPFADLIVAETPEDIREMTRLIADRVKSSNTASTESASAGEETSTEESEGSEEEGSTSETEGSQPEGDGDGGEGQSAPVAGGGAAFSTEASTDDRVNEALERKSFADFINAKWEKQTVAEGDGNLELG